MRAIPILTSIAELAATSDAWIVDIWGVMHNGERAYPAAAEACRAFRAARRHGGAALQCAAPVPGGGAAPDRRSACRPMPTTRASPPAT